jgi:hypothetical protein
MRAERQAARGRPAEGITYWPLVQVVRTRPGYAAWGPANRVGILPVGRDTTYVYMSAPLHGFAASYLDAAGAAT